MDFRGQKSSVVSKLRVRGERIDGVSARLNLERLFAATDLAPAGLPPQAIVCIKKISDPQPRSLRLDYSGLRFAETWQTAVAREVENLYRRAFRPVNETVPAMAESVVFADRAELLACLASDWRRGKLSENWWWRAIFPKFDEAQTVVKIWLESAEYAPHALLILAKKREAISFVQKLQPHEVKLFLRKITQIFALQKLEAVLFESLAKKARTESGKGVELSETDKFLQVLDVPALLKIESEIRALLPEVKTTVLNLETQILLETVLLLARSPKIARSAEFAHRARIYRHEKKSNKDSDNEIIKKFIERITAFRETVKKSKKGKAILKQGEQILTKAGKKEIKISGQGAKIKRLETGEKPQTDEKTQPRLAETKQPESKVGAKKLEAPKPKFEDDQAVKNAENFETEAKAKSQRIISQTEKTAFERYFEETETGIEYSFQTRFGGIFYLLNLGLYLEFYSDFTESVPTEIDLNIWDFTALLSLEFLGERIKSDAVWDFLKIAAECERDEDFGRGFNNFQDWRVPAKWLETFPANQKWLFGKKGKRLILRHAAGFSVVDVLLTEDFDSQLKKESEVYRNYFSEIVPAEKRNLRSLKKKKWLENLTEFLEKRLFRALNVETPEKLNAILFERSASVLLTATHLEITFSLADLPFEVRLAGIDRDPGWIPAVGRFVYFHFV